MAQLLKIGAITGSGIVAVLFVMGLILKMTNINSGWGDGAIFAGILIAVIFGFLGILGIIKNLTRR